ncbi:MAG: SCO family protein [Planctomycetes bacterium]|nr:SCO family protein [Planctomycetota bacterium]
MKRFLLFLMAATGLLHAQQPGMSPSRTIEARDEAASQTNSIDTLVDRDLAFTDDRGYPFTLKQLFPGKQPVVLMLGYYHCPAMCGQVLDATFRALSQVDLRPGTDYRILSVSIDPKETPEMAKARKDVFLPRLQKAGGDDAWRLLVGDATNTKKLADQCGFQFYWSEHTKQYAHPPSLVFLTPEGRVSRVIVNTEFDASDVRLALVEASKGTLGTVWDKVQLNCLTFDPRTNTYSLTAMTIMRVAGAVTVVVLALMIWIMLKKERKQHAAAVA